jgi:hypothetical protein
VSAAPTDDSPAEPPGTPVESRPDATATDVVAVDEPDSTV